MPFYIRIKENLTIGRAAGELFTANCAVRKLKNSNELILKENRYLDNDIFGPLCRVLRLQLCETQRQQIIINFNYAH